MIYILSWILIGYCFTLISIRDGVMRGQKLEDIGDIIVLFFIIPIIWIVIPIYTFKDEIFELLNKKIY